MRYLVREEGDVPRSKTRRLSQENNNDDLCRVFSDELETGNFSSDLVESLESVDEV